MNMAGIDSLATRWFEFLGPAAFEAALVGLLLWIVVRLGGRLPSSWRYGLVVLALVKFLLPPVPAPWALRLELPEFAAPTNARLLPAPLSLPANPDQLRRPTTESDDVTLASTAPSAQASPRAAIPDGAGSTLVRRPQVPEATSRPLGFGARLLLLQAVGALCLILARGRQLLALRRVVRATRPVHDRALLAMVDEASAKQGLRRPPVLVESPAGIGPAAAGLWYPRIILPAALIESVPPAALRPVIVHEVAHHCRRDLWVEALVFCGALVWWAHPVYWLLRHELRRVGEDCCDDLAVVETGGASAYCQALLDAATALAGRRPALPAVAHGSFSHPLGRRIRRIMNPSTRPSPRLSLLASAALVALAVLVVPSPATFGAPQEASAPRSTAAPAPAPESGQPTAELPSAAAAPLSAPAASASHPSAATAPEPLGQSAAARSSASAGQRRSYSYSNAGRSVRFGVDDGILEISSGAVGAFADRGLDSDFISGLDGAPDRNLTLAEVRGWVEYGLDPTLPDALASLAVERLRTIDLLALIWNNVSGAYIRELQATGLPNLDLDEVNRLARYEVSTQYIEAFRQQGYTELDVDDLVRLTRYEVEPGYAGTYRDAGYELSVDDLVQLHRYEVDEQAVARLAAVGLDDLAVDDLVTLKRYEVDDAYIRAMTEDGTVDLNTEQLVQLKRYDVTPQYAVDMRAAGLHATTDGLVQLKRYEVEPMLVRRLRDLGQTDLAVDDLVRLQRYEVNPDYVSGLQTLGYTSPSVDDLVTLQRYEVDLDRLAALAEAGYERLPVSDVVKLQRYEVTADYIRSMGQLVTRQLSVDDLVTLRRYEVSPAYVSEMESAGIGELGVEDLVRLKRYEVSAAFIRRLVDAGFEDLDIDKIIRFKRAEG